MPFEAAKAIAATFCYNIRYALIPLFGPSFAPMCIKPSGEGFGQMLIDPELISRCTQEARHYRDLASREKFQASRSTTPDSTPTTPSLWSRHIKSRGQQANSESTYSSDQEGSESYLPSPQSTTKWTPANLAKCWPRALELPAAQDGLSKFPVTGQYNERSRSPGASSSGSDISPKTSRNESRAAIRGMAREENSPDQCLGRSTSPPSRSASPITASKETKAAYVLMQLHLAETTPRETEQNVRKRRASS